MQRNLKKDKDVEMKHIFWVLLRKKWVIVLVSLFCAAIFYAYSVFVVTPMYKSSVSFYVSNSSGGGQHTLTNSDVTAAENLVDTYVYILSSNTVLNAVAQQSNLGMTGTALRELVTVSRIGEIGLCKVEIVTPEAQLSADVADAIARFAPAEVSAIVEGSSLKVVEQAETPEKPDTPNVLRNTLTGLLLGLIFSMCTVLLRSVLRVQDAAVR